MNARAHTLSKQLNILLGIAIIQAPRFCRGFAEVLPRFFRGFPVVSVVSVVPSGSRGFAVVSPRFRIDFSIL